MVEVMKIMGTSFKRSSAESPGHSQESLDQSLWGHCSFLLGPGAQKLCLRCLSISGRHGV